MKKTTSCLTALLVVCMLHVNSAVTVANNNPADLKDSAKAVVSLLVAEDFKAVWNQFDEQMKQGLTPERMQEVWASVLKNAGSFKRQVSAQQRSVQGLEVVTVKCEFERDYVQVRVAYNSQEQIAGLWVLPGNE